MTHEELFKWVTEAYNIGAKLVNSSGAIVDEKTAQVDVDILSNFANHLLQLKESAGLDRAVNTKKSIFVVGKEGNC